MQSVHEIIASQHVFVGLLCAQLPLFSRVRLESLSRHVEAGDREWTLNM